MIKIRRKRIFRRLGIPVLCQVLVQMLLGLIVLLSVNDPWRLSCCVALISKCVCVCVCVRACVRARARVCVMYSGVARGGPRGHSTPPKLLVNVFSPIFYVVAFI